MCRSVHAEARLLFAALMLAAGGPARAESTPTGANVNALYQAGLAYQQQADRTRAQAEAAALYQKAIAQYSQVTKLKPEFHGAHASWGGCLLGLAQCATESEQRRANIQAALARFDAAARCPDVDWTTFG